MVRPRGTGTPMVLLIGNYAPDRQQSMQRFSAMMLQGLRSCGLEAELIHPPAVLGRIGLFGSSATKWLGYIDKFVLFRWRLWRRLARQPALVHICDHSNSTYARAARRFPLVITCHDMLAVRGGLGEETDCPASFTGRMLQRWILRGLGRADVLACVSQATAEDARRLVRHRADGSPRIELAELGLSYPYRPLDRRGIDQRLSGIEGLNRGGRYILHVGSNLRRKNREAVLRIFSKCATELDAQMVFVGDLLSESLRRQATKLGVAHRIVEIGIAADELLEALYSGAFALLYPSRFEGFGWPIIEAQACGCPVVCSSAGPMAGIAGAGALLRAPEDEDGFATDLLRLAQPGENERWKTKALENSRRYSSTTMIAKYIVRLSPHVEESGHAFFDGAALADAAAISGEPIRFLDSSDQPDRVRLDLSAPAGDGGEFAHWPSDSLQKHRSAASRGAHIDRTAKLDHRISEREQPAFHASTRPAAGPHPGATRWH
jgi:glycosyltransferase involved in cell wall biosynthesis